MIKFPTIQSARDYIKEECPNFQKTEVKNNILYQIADTEYYLMIISYGGYVIAIVSPRDGPRPRSGFYVYQTSSLLDRHDLPNEVKDTIINHINVLYEP